MNSKNTKRALFSSILALVLCFSMMLGTTFAWFTDEVTSANNIITAGNLDVEVTNDEGDIEKQDALFDHVTLWEPGVVAYENLTVANVGTLALQYKMNIVFTEQNTVVDNGLGLADVLKVAVLDKKVEETDRDALTSSITNWALLSDLDEVGKLYPEGSTEGASSEDFAIVIWWEPSDEDNKWNVNNGRETSDDKPLHITLGLNLTAIQLSYEEDSYGDDYDSKTLEPDADVLPYSGTNIKATIGMGGEKVDRTLDVAYQFLPSETKDEALAGGYGYWHADYVVTVDKDIKAGQAGLAGYYTLFCKGYNEDRWVALEGADLAANTPLRLIEAMGGGSITVNYSEICEFGNDGVGFLCGAWAVEDLAGMTLTVELRLYETEEPSESNGNSHNVETGEYITVGTYTWTVPYTDGVIQKMIDNAAAGDTVQLPAGHWGNLVVTNSGITIQGGEGVVVDSINLNGKSDVTLKDIEFDAAGAERGYDGSGTARQYANIISGGTSKPAVGARNIVIDGCTFAGTFADGGAAIAFADKGRPTGGSGDVTIQNCTFETEGANCDVYGYYTGNPGLAFTIQNNTFASECLGGPVYLGRLATSEAIVVKGNTFKTVDSIENAVGIQAHSAGYTPTLDAADNTFMA